MEKQVWLGFDLIKTASALMIHTWLHWTLFIHILDIFCLNLFFLLIFSFYFYCCLFAFLTWTYICAHRTFIHLLILDFMVLGFSSIMVCDSTDVLNCGRHIGSQFCTKRKALNQSKRKQHRLNHSHLIFCFFLTSLPVLVV